jgi:hypothetical protein
VTNYAKRHNIVVVTEHVKDAKDYTSAKDTKHTRDRDVSSPVHTNVYFSYRDQLRAYTKQQFDPFRRRDRIDFYYEKRKCIETTIGQLNFFKWMLQNQLLDYIDDHIDAIEAEMLESQRSSRNVRHADYPELHTYMTSDTSPDTSTPMHLLKHVSTSPDTTTSPDTMDNICNQDKTTYDQELDPETVLTPTRKPPTRRQRLRSGPNTPSRTTNITTTHETEIPRLLLFN